MFFANVAVADTIVGVDGGPVLTWDFGPATRHLQDFRAGILVDKQDKLPPILAGAAATGTYTGNDTCRWANDGECDDPGIGTGACAQGTDYSDCWRIATQREDDSCQWANDGECDEPHLGTGACTQGTDRTDCGAIAFLRFTDDSCVLALNGVCNEPGTGDGACTARSDRGDCIGRDRPMGIDDHYFGHDDRVILDTSLMPWSVIGVLESESGSCTATLVAPDVLVTAAHCIETDNGVDARQTFTTAFRPGGFAASATVIAYLQAPDRFADRSSGHEASGTDWALLRLDQPIGDKLGFLGVRPLLATYGEQAVLGLQVFQAGYSWDTGDNLSGNLGCAFVRVEDGNRVAHNCDTTHGDSGSPLLVREGDLYFIVATDSTFRREDTGPVINIATRSDGWVGLLADFVAGRTGDTNLVSIGRRK